MTSKNHFFKLVVIDNFNTILLLRYQYKMTEV